MILTIATVIQLLLLTTGVSTMSPLLASKGLFLPRVTSLPLYQIMLQLQALGSTRRMGRNGNGNYDVGMEIEALSVTMHPAWSLLDQHDCGDSAGDRIIGGKDAALGQFPWMSRLGYVSKSVHWKTAADIVAALIDFRCGGVLVSDRHVVTAAHCILSPDDDDVMYVARLGEHDIRDNPDCQDGMCAPPVQDMLIDKVFGHPSFNNPPAQNDIAVVSLKSPASLNDYVLPICLRRTQDSLKLKELVTAAGWGKINMTTEDNAVILQFIQLPVLNPDKCSYVGEALSSGQICAGGQKNKDACVGDSGGPLSKVYDTPDGPKSYLVGVVSFGPTHCGRKAGVYSSVSYFLPWILDQLVK